MPYTPGLPCAIEITGLPTDVLLPVTAYCYTFNYYHDCVTIHCTHIDPWACALMWSNAASTSPPLLVLFIVEFFLVGDNRPPVLGGVAFRVSIGARGAVVDDLRLLLPLDNLMDLVTDVLLRPAFEAERGLVSVLDLPKDWIELLPPPLAELLAWEIFLSLVSVALAPGLIFLGSISPLLTRRTDFRAGDVFSTSVAVRELFRVVPLAASICTADLDFIECLPAFVWCSDDSAARLGLALCGGVL